MTHKGFSRFLVATTMLAAPGVALAQASNCPSPAYEKRMNAAVAKYEPAMIKIPASKANAFAACQARVICSRGLDKTEFEMYALDVIKSYGDEAADREFSRRFKRDNRKHMSGGDKVGSPNAVRDLCKKEVGG